MEELISTFLGSNGVVVQILSVVGLLRILIKPIMEMVKAYTAFTPSTKDDSFVNKVIASPIYTKLLFVLDWLTSIKIKK